MVGGRQSEEKREKGRRDGVPAKVEHGRVPPRIRFRVPVALMTAILPPLAPLVLPYPTITPLPSSHHRESHPPLRGDAPCPPLPLSLSPSLSQPSTQYTSRMTRITSQRRERATCSPLLPSLSPFPSLPPRKVPTLCCTSTDPTPPRFPSCPAAGYTVYTRYMWCSIYLFRYSGRHSTRPRGSRQSPLVHRAACLLFPRSPRTRSRRAG